MEPIKPEENNTSKETNKSNGDNLQPRVWSSQVHLIESHSASVKWLLASILSFSVTLLVLFYTSNFSNIDYAIQREENTLNDDKLVDTLRSLLYAQNHYYLVDEEDSLLIINKLKQTQVKNRSQNDTSLVKLVGLKMDTLRKVVFDSTKRLIQAKIDLMKKITKDIGEVYSVPIINLRLTFPEFCLVLMIFSSAFALWLTLLLSSIKHALLRINNQNNPVSDEEADLINSYLYLLLPNKYTMRIYQIVEITFGVLIFSICVICYELIKETFFEGAYGIPFIKNPSCGKMLTWYVVYGFSLVGIIAFACSLFYYTKKSLLHIRNLLVLVRWGGHLIWPTLDKIVSEKKNGKLIKKRNIVEYRMLHSRDDYKLIIYLEWVVNKEKSELSEYIKEKSAIPEQKKETEEVKKVALITARVNFSKSIRKFYSHYQFEKEPLVTYDEKKGRILTFEEKFMQDFFATTLTKSGYEDELYERTIL